MCRGQQLVDLVGHLLDFPQLVQICLAALKKLLIPGKKCRNVLLQAVDLVIAGRRGFGGIPLFIHERYAAGACLRRILLVALSIRTIVNG